jgi:hypothetical protein
MASRHHRDWEEMPKMCALLSTGPRNEMVCVNPSNVRYVRPGSPGSTAIHFANDQSISVAMDVQDVIRALDVAMNVDHA